MRRSYLLALVAVALLVLLAWVARQAERGVLSPVAARGVAAQTTDAVAGDDGDDVAEPGDRDVEWATIRCTWEGEGPPGTLRARRLEPAEEGDPAPAAVSDSQGGLLTLHVPPGAWSVDWTNGVTARTVGTLVLTAGETRTCRIGVMPTLTGRVVNASGAPVSGAEVVGCGPMTVTGADGGFGVRQRMPLCELRARWTDGALSRYSEAVAVPPDGPFDGFVLRVDDAPIGGLGIQLSPHGDGVMVEDVLLDTPADGAGLLPGDLVTSVDGTSTAGMQPLTFSQLATGAPGTTVRVTVMRKGRPLNLTLTRAPVAEPRDTGGR